MGTFVGQVLAERERVKMEEAEQETYSLLNDTLSLKHDYIEALESHYVKLIKPLISTPYLVTLENLQRSSRTLSQTLQEAQPTPTFSVVQLETLLATKEEVNSYLCILKQLADLDSTLCTVKMNYNSKNLLECARNLGLCQSLLKEEASSKEIVEIVNAMKPIWTRICGSLMLDLTNMWHEHISFKDLPRSSKKNHKVVCLNVSIKEKKQFVMILEATKYVDLQDHIVKNFGSMLLDHVFKPLIEHECIVKKEVKSSMCMSSLEVTIQESSPSPTYAIVLHNCKLVFEYLNENINLEISENIKFLNMVGRFIGRKFCNIIYKMSFLDSKDMEKFSSDVIATEAFKRYLNEIGFILSDVPSQEQQVDEMFEHLKSCTIIAEARSEMHKKIFETVIVKQIFSRKQHHYQSSFNKMGAVGMDDLEKWKMIPNELKISKSTQDAIDKVSHLLELANKEEFECLNQLHTVKSILVMYAVLLPEECQELARNSAQISAIIFNNCSHFCEWIFSLGPKYHDYFPKLSKYEVGTFTQEAINIWEAGTKIFQGYVEVQIVQLTAMISESELSGKDFSKHEEALKSCLKTIKTLKSAWENLLAYYQYIETMGEIINLVLKEWTVKILLSPKISSDLAMCLRVLIQEMVTKLIMNFSEKELSNVRYLEKLKSIQMVLEGSTSEIIHKWKKGNGPLAASLTADELKKLIRSLFEDKEIVYILNRL